MSSIQDFETRMCVSPTTDLHSKLCESEKDVSDDKVSCLSNELFMLSHVNGGFVSADSKERLIEMGASTEQIEAVDRTRGRLLGGAGPAAAIIIGMIAMAAIEHAFTAAAASASGQSQRDVFNYNWIRETQDNLDKEGINAYCASYYLDDGKFDANFTGVKWERREIVAGCRFQLTIFTGGSLKNRGDGGYLNWGFTGGTRSGNNVTWS